MGNVTFTFNQNNYTCLPEKRYLPPAGGGSYYVYKNILFLQDKVPHTAEFDWSLILDGEFNIDYNGEILILKQIDKRYNRYRIISLRKID